MKKYLQSFKPQLFKSKITIKSLKADIVAGLTVGVVAIPLSLVFAIRSSFPPSAGLVGAVIAGIIAAFLGGSKYQITGSTAAFVALSLSVIDKIGFIGHAAALFLAGIILILAGFLGFGKLIKYITPAIVAGFTAGIAATLFLGQIPAFFGLKMSGFPPHFIGRVRAIFSATSVRWEDVIVGFTSLSVLIFLPKKVSKYIPSSIVAIIAGSTLDFAFRLNVHTIGSNYGDIHLKIRYVLSFSATSGKIADLISAAVTIAFLSAVVSLLSAKVADSLSGEKHNSNVELIAQGAANTVCGMFGLLPSAGGVARTAINYKTGAKSPLSAIIQAITILLIALLFMPVLKVMPLSSLAAVLIGSCKNMINLKQLKSFIKIDRFEFLVFVCTTLVATLISLPLSVFVGLFIYYLRHFIFLHKNKNDKATAYVKENQLYITGYLSHLNIDKIKGSFKLEGQNELNLQNLSGFDYYGGQFLKSLINAHNLKTDASLQIIKTLSKY